MTEVNKFSPPVQNFALLGSWIEEPCHFNAKRHGFSEYTLTESYRHMTAINDVLHSDTDNSDRIKAVNRGSLESGPENGQETHKPKRAPQGRYIKSLVPPNLQHPGAVTLLDEYYRLMTDQALKHPQSVSHKYCPSFKTQMWQIMTAELPPCMTLTSVTSGFRSFADRTAPEQRMPIVALLVVWLYMFKLLIFMEFIHPVSLICFACIGICILFLSEEKLQAFMKQTLKPGYVFRKFDVGERLNSSSSAFLHAFHKAVNETIGGSATD